MSFGGSSQPTSTVTQVEKLPPELVPFYQDLLGRGVFESLTGYETYPFRRLADFDPYEAGAQEAYAEMALAGTPESVRDAQAGLREIALGTPYARSIQTDPAVQRLTEEIIGATEAQSQRLIDPVAQQPRQQPFGSLEEQQADPRVQEINRIQGELAEMDQRSPEGQTLVGQIQSLQDDIFSETAPAPRTRLDEYMNPFQQAFVDRQKRLAREESERQQKEIAQAAAVAGGLGGYREGIMQSERQRNLSNQLQDIQAAGDLENFRQAQQAFEADRLARQRGADIGLAGFAALGQDVDRRGRAAESMAALAGQRQAMEFDRLGQLESAGARRRQLAQQGLDIGYQDFLRQQAFPREQLNLYSGLLRGVPVGPGTYQATYGNQPSAFQQLVGTGLGAAALYGGTRGYGNTGLRGA